MGLAGNNNFLLPSEWLEPRRSNAKKLDFSAVVNLFIPLVIVAICVFLFKPENDLGFGDAFPVIALLSLVHAFLPMQLRLILFIGMGLAVLVFLMGLTSALMFFLVAVTVFLVLDRPMSFYIRLSLLLMLFFAMYLSRKEWIDYPYLVMIFPFFGTLFMFRSISYLYERSVATDKTPLLIRFSYFFLFPNFFFLLFPILDYKKFSNSWYSVPSKELYRNAIRHLMIGLFFSLLYRFVYLYISPEPVTVDNAEQLIVFLLSGFCLSLRMVGLFFLGAGTLGLFGFSLPDVFGNYFTADSFTLVWQRINVYWKDFVIRIFYYPVYFVFKTKIKEEQNIARITILLVFLISALMHSWQQYWITGDFVLRPADLIFWMLFGFLIVFESRLRRSHKSKVSLVRKALSAFLVFVCMVLLYSFWTGSGIREWVYILSRFSVDSSGAIVTLAIVFILYILFYFVTHYATSVSPIKRGVHVLLLVFFATISAVKLSKPETKGMHRGMIEEFSDPAMMNKRDRKSMERGYYSKILNPDDVLRRTSDFKTGENWNPHNYLVRYRKDIIYRELLPDTTLSFKGADVITNSVGLRDQEYSLQKDHKTIRMALLGGSYEMGSGVRQEYDFESLTEANLNAVFPDKKTEIWNYGLGGYGLLQAIGISDQKLRNHEFDYLIYVAHSGEMERIAGDLTFLIRKKVNLMYPELRQLISEAGVNPEMCDLEIEQRLFSFSHLIFKWGIEKINTICKEENMIPVMVYLPTLGVLPDEHENNQIWNVSRDLQWSIIDLSSVYEEEYLSDLYLTKWDNHPNERGHQVISGLLSQKLLQVIRSNER